MRAPYGEVGKLESAWFPLVVSADGRAIDPEEYCTVEFPDVDSPKVCNRQERRPMPPTVQLDEILMLRVVVARL